jgi:hypothetical protein
MSEARRARHPLEQARAAQQAFADKRHVGKVVLDVDSARP